MGFPIINMTNWDLHYYSDKFFLTGTADNHPRLGRNVYVSRTSTIVQVISYIDDVVTFETRNSVYVCPLKYAAPQRREYKPDLRNVINVELYRLCSLFDKYVSGVEDASVEHLKQLMKQGQYEIEFNTLTLKKRLIEEAKKYENSIYLEVSNIASGDLLAYNIGDESGVLSPYIHVGTFQDSILYMEDCIVDFRYFPKGDWMEIYNWSENIENVVIKNLKEYEIKVDTQIIKPGETVVINKETYNCQLISPDCVTGQSMFLGSLSGDEDSSESEFDDIDFETWGSMLE